jgi:hypothetical protein
MRQCLNFVCNFLGADHFISLLDKMISENINKDFFKDNIIEEGVVERIPKGTLRLFEEWLMSIFHHPNSELVKNIFNSFKEIRRQRQQPAQNIIENKYDEELSKKQNDILDQIYRSMKSLRIIFKYHPSAIDFNIPEWLDNGEIKSF